MSLEIEDQSVLDKASEAFDGSQKRSKISYTRGFLLSLGELEICKKLPRGFDRSLLGDFEIASHDLQERSRISGVFQSQGFRRTEYGSSPPTKGDSSNCSRVIYGRWDSRSSGRSDKDGDSQSDWDTVSGRRYGNPSRRSRQSPEHDGLLGSGSFPRPSEYAAGVPAPKVKGDDHYQLKKSNEPYHPPRPYKAAPHTRRETNDSLNDETFGSTEFTSQDRAEEEKRRRASFELMRKEQQKVLQEKQKLHVDKHKDDIFSDESALLEQTKEGKVLERNNDLDGSGSRPFSDNDSGISSFHLQSSAPRPLVPPGFTSTVLEKNSGAKSLSYTHDKEVGKPELEERILDAKAIPVQNGIPDSQEDGESVYERVMSEQQPEDKGIRAVFPTQGELIVNSLAGLGASNKRLGLDDHLYSTSSLLKAPEAMDDGEVVQLISKVTEDNNVSNSNQESSTSILEKLFGSSITVNTTSNFTKPNDGKPDVTWSPNTSQSSRFAHWFVEDEKKASDVSPSRPRDLLSLIVGGDKGGSQVSDLKPTQHILPEFTHESSDLTNKLASKIPLPATTGISEQLYNGNKQEVIPAVLTCEDLEQKILSEYSENTTSLQDSNVSGDKMAQPEANVDNLASLHLLSLLQKGTSHKDMALFPNVDIGSSEKLLVPEIVNIGTVVDKPLQEANAEIVHDSGKAITLETLFGTAFMKELQSVEAPVSVHRSAVGSVKVDVVEPHGMMPFPLTDDGSLPSTVEEIKSNRMNFENNILASTKQQTKSEKGSNWLGYEDPQFEVESSKFLNEGSLGYGFDGAAEVQLPEEESLIAVSDPLNPNNSMFMPAGNLNKGEYLSSNTSIGIVEKLAALNAGYKNERPMITQEGPPFVRGPYDPMEFERQYHVLHAKPSMPQYHSPQINHGRPFLHRLDSHPTHITSQMKFMAPESIIQHDVPSPNQFPMSMLRPPFNHPNAGPTGFDRPGRHQMLQQMQMPGNFTLPNLLHEFPRGAPIPQHPSNQSTAFMQEPNLMQGFPFGQRQPNIGGLGMPLPAPDVVGASNHPEALQRLIGMELRANPRQVHPFAVGNSQGVYNHELDMGFRYRQ